MGDQLAGLLAHVSLRACHPDTLHSHGPQLATQALQALVPLLAWAEGRAVALPSLCLCLSEAGVGSGDGDGEGTVGAELLETLEAVGGLPAALVPPELAAVAEEAEALLLLLLLARGGGAGR